MKNRYALAFATVVPGCPRGRVYASFGGRRFADYDAAVEAMEAERRPLFVTCVVDVGRMRVAASEAPDIVFRGEPVVWIKNPEPVTTG